MEVDNRVTALDGAVRSGLAGITEWIDQIYGLFARGAKGASSGAPMSAGLVTS